MLLATLNQGSRQFEIKLEKTKTRNQLTKNLKKFKESSFNVVKRLQIKRKRNKLIKIADSTEEGWDVIAENKKETIGSNSNDCNIIR